MEDNLDLVAKGDILLENLCAECDETIDIESTGNFI